MKRKSIGARHEMIVQPTFIIGTFNQDGTPDFAPITWVSKTCEEGDTCLIVISMYGTKQTKQNVLRTGQLTVNLATTGMLPLVDYFGQTSGKEGLKDALPYAWGRALWVEAPTLDESPWVCECQVASQVATGESDTFFCRIPWGSTWGPSGISIKNSLSALPLPGSPCRKSVGIRYSQKHIDR